LQGLAVARTLLHRAWQRLPPTARRRLYEWATEAAAPRPGPVEKRPRWREPYIVAGALSAPTGLGEAARLLLRGFMACGRDVRAIDLSGPLRQRSLVPVPDLPPPEQGPGTLILAVQPPNAGHALASIGRPLLAGKTRIAHWVWDLEIVPPSWVRQSRLVHGFAAPSAFVARALEKGFGQPVALLRYPVALGRAMDPPQPDRASGRVRFGAALDLGSTSARKNPVGVLQAYRAAFGPEAPVSLDLKLRDPGAEPAAMAEIERLIAEPGPPVHLTLGDLGPQALEAWWRGLDVFVSLHRSEGFGLLPAEAMLRGIPAVSTDWSATAEFIDSAVGWPVPSALVPAMDATGRYALPGAAWAEPDLAAAATALRQAAEPGAAVTRAAAAQGKVQALFGTEPFERALTALEAGS
jgi:glycosyltransferase involved in cell wall biosynthesis